MVLHAPVHVEMQRDGVHRLYSADVWEDLEIRILIVADRYRDLLLVLVSIEILNRLLFLQARTKSIQLVQILKLIDRFNCLMQASVEAEKVLNPYAHPHTSFFKYLT